MNRFIAAIQIPIALVVYAKACWSLSIPKPKSTSAADAAKLHGHRRTRASRASTEASVEDLFGIIGEKGIDREEAVGEMGKCVHDSQPTSDDHRDQARRAVLATLFSLVALSNTANNPAAAAGDDEFGSMNGLTRQIRRSVVQGAQLVDRFDGRWERFSDDFGLGSERNRPKRRGIDAGGNERSKEVARSEVAIDVGDLVLDGKFAFELLRECDEAFLSCLKSQPSSTSIPKQQLDQQIEETKQLLRKSFLSSSKTGVPTSLEEFNFECYVHFKVFNEMLVKQKVNFPPFGKEFESVIGIRLFHLALQQQPSLLPSQIDSNTPRESLQQALRTTDAIANLLQKKGLITSWERSIPPDDDVDDFATTSKSSADNFSVSSDLPYSLALNGDVTLGSQLLLQELGYRLYPSFGRWLVREGASRCFGGEAGNKVGNKVVVQIDDYYMDTNYNSNPDLFEVKQVLLNIVIQRD